MDIFLVGKLSGALGSEGCDLRSKVQPVASYRWCPSVAAAGTTMFNNFINYLDDGIEWNQQVHCL